MSAFNEHDLKIIAMMAGTAVLCGLLAYVLLK
jgi:hypothetical protein